MAGKTATGRATARYAAFISYSHADSDMCDRLHKRLESYRVPHSLLGRAGPDGKLGRRLGKFFRDRVDLGAHHDLGAEIREALDNAAALIVLCSPRSAGSAYVAEEIRYFKSLGRADRVFAAIISGEPHAAGKPGLTAADECFPEALVRRLGEDGSLTHDSEPAEPIAADLRDRKDGLENGSLKLIAGLLDIGLDDLVQREKQAEARRRRQAYLLSGMMGALALGAGAGGVLAYVNGETVKAQAAELDRKNTELEANLAQIARQKADLDRQLRQNKALTTRITSVVSEISEIAAQDDTVPEQLLFLSYGARLGMSAVALKTMFDGEIGAMRALPVTNYAGSYCMGFTYCDGTFTVDALRADWAPVLKAEDLERVASVWGVKPEPSGSDFETADPRYTAIKRAEDAVADIVITRRAALDVFSRVQLPRFADQVRQFWPNADELPPDAFGALVYAVIYFGSNVVARMAADVAAGKFPDAAAGLRDLGARQSVRAPSERIAGVIMQRAEEQAKLFERGMASATSTSAEAPG